MFIPESLKIVEALAPATDAAGRTSDYVSLKNVQRAWILVHLDQGNAATVALTPEQATAVAGTGSKALTNNIPIWANQDCAASDALARQTDDVDFTTSAAVKRKLIILGPIQPASLDVAGGFDCLAILTGASDAANITSATFLLEMRYAGVTTPSVIVD